MEATKSCNCGSDIPLFLTYSLGDTDQAYYTLRGEYEYEYQEIRIIRDSLEADFHSHRKLLSSLAPLTGTLR